MYNFYWFFCQVIENNSVTQYDFVTQETFKSNYYCMANKLLPNYKQDNTQLKVYITTNPVQAQMWEVVCL